MKIIIPVYDFALSARIIIMIITIIFTEQLTQNKESVRVIILCKTRYVTKHMVEVS